jgi:predicted dehydrogenase
MEDKTNSSNESKCRQITGIIVGCGNRGQNYAEYARHFPERFRLIAIADSRLVIRQKLQKIYSLDDQYIFDDWRELVAPNVQRLADCALITLPDREHYEAAIQLANKGYHILLEKPMATKIEHCKQIVQVCQANNLLLAVCHVLRYLPVIKKIKQLIDDNVIGKLVSIQHIEPIGAYLLFIKILNLSLFCFRILAFCAFICPRELA